MQRLPACPGGTLSCDTPGPHCAPWRTTATPTEVASGTGAGTATTGGPPASGGPARSPGWQPLVGCRAARPAAGHRPGPTRRPIRPWSPTCGPCLEYGPRCRVDAGRRRSAAGGDHGPADRVAGLPGPPDPAEPTGRPRLLAALACGALVGALFRQLVTTGIDRRPIADGLDALAVDEHRTAGGVDRAAGAGRAVASCGPRSTGRPTGCAAAGPRLDPAWLPRTQECLRVPLAGGAVELVGPGGPGRRPPGAGRGVGGPGGRDLRGAAGPATGPTAGSTPWSRPCGARRPLRCGHLLHADGRARRRPGHPRAAGGRGTPAAGPASGSLAGAVDAGRPTVPSCPDRCRSRGAPAPAVVARVVAATWPSASRCRPGARRSRRPVRPVAAGRRPRDRARRCGRRIVLLGPGGHRRRSGGRAGPRCRRPSSTAAPGRGHRGPGRRRPGRGRPCPCCGGSAYRPDGSPGGRTAPSPGGRRSPGARSASPPCGPAPRAVPGPGRGRRPGGRQAVDEWRRTGWRTFHWEPWFAGLGPGGRAAVLAEAVTWATPLWAAPRLGRVGPRAVSAAPTTCGRCPATRTVRLRGRCGGRVASAGRPAPAGRHGRRAGAGVGGRRDARRRAGRRSSAYLALVAGLADAGRGRCRPGWSACGRRPGAPDGRGRRGGARRRRPTGSSPRCAVAGGPSPRRRGGRPDRPTPGAGRA